MESPFTTLTNNTRPCPAKNCLQRSVGNNRVYKARKSARKSLPGGSYLTKKSANNQQETSVPNRDFFDIQAFSIEIFQHILLQLSPYTIVRVLPLVSKSWRTLTYDNVFLRNVIIKNWPDVSPRLTDNRLGLRRELTVKEAIINLTWGLKKFYTHEVQTQLLVHDDVLFRGSQNGMITARDQSTGSLITTFPGHKRNITSLTLDNCFLYSGSADGTIKRWDLTRLKLKKEYLTGEPVDRIWVTNGLLVATRMMRTMNDHAIAKVWDVETAQVVNTIQIRIFGSLNIEIYRGSIFFSDYRCNILRHDLRTGLLVSIFHGYGKDFDTYIDRFKITDNTLVASTFQGNIKTWNIDTQVLINSYKSNAVYNGSFEINGGILYASTQEGNIVSWNKLTAVQQKPIKLFEDHIHWIKIDEDILYAHNRDTFVIYDLARERIIYTMKYKQLKKVIVDNNKLTISLNAGRKIKIINLDSQKKKPNEPQTPIEPYKNFLVPRRDSQQPHVKYTVG